MAQAELKLEALVSKLEQLDQTLIQRVSDFVDGIFAAQQEDEPLLTDEEKNILDQRWAKYEKNGVEGYTLEEVLQEINKKHGI